MGGGSGSAQQWPQGPEEVELVESLEAKLCEPPSTSAGNEVLQSCVRVAYGVISPVPRSSKGFYMDWALSPFFVWNRGPQAMEKKEPEWGKHWRSQEETTFLFSFINTVFLFFSMLRTKSWGSYMLSTASIAELPPSWLINRCLSSLLQFPVKAWIIYPGLT